MRLSEPTTKIWIKTDLYFQRRCSAMNLVSGNIWLMRIFAGVPWRGVKRQWGYWGNRKQIFRAFGRCLRHLRKWGQYYYIVLFSSLLLIHWPQNTWPWMTLMVWTAIFTLQFHHYQLPWSNYLLFIYCRVCFYTCDQRRNAGSGVADRDPQNIWNPRKNCGSFVDATSSES